MSDQPAFTNLDELKRHIPAGAVPVVHAGKLGPLPDPLPPETPTHCPICQEDFRPGAHYTLIPVGPGGLVEARRAARFGGKFDVVGIIVCWACVSGEAPVPILEPVPDEQTVVEAMVREGGSFVAALGQAFQHADASNFHRLKLAFPTYWRQYEQAALERSRFRGV